MLIVILKILKFSSILAYLNRKILFPQPLVNHILKIKSFSVFNISFIMFFLILRMIFLLSCTSCVTYMIFSFFNCASYVTYMIFFFFSCTSCVTSSWACSWCPHENKCTHNVTICSRTVISGENVSCFIQAKLIFISDRKMHRKS